MPSTSQGATFSFPGIAATYTSIQVEDPEPEVVDMTPWNGSLGVKQIVYTGDMKSPGRVTVDYLREQGNMAPLTMTGSFGILTITFPNNFAGGFASALSTLPVTVQRFALLEKANTEIAVGDMVRGRLSFLIDHTQ